MHLPFYESILLVSAFSARRFVVMIIHPRLLRTTLGWEFSSIRAHINPVRTMSQRAGSLYPSPLKISIVYGLTNIYAEVEIPQDPNFFHYTRGRFIRDEACEMAGRSISFNVDELAIVAASAVGAKACVKFEKYPDGMYNKVFGLTMDNGVQVVAKLPNPNAGRPHFTTASEVATMEFVCILSFPPNPTNLETSYRQS